MSKIKEVELEYVYVTIPADYICVYHRILAMLADYGEEMLKDCKASCTDRNSSVIECYNMFNAAVAARKLGKDKLAETLIKYIKAKINQIYQGHDNSTSFIFPVDEDGHIQALVSCGERPKFEIDPDDGELFEHKFNNGFDEHFRLGPEDNSAPDGTPVEESVLEVLIIPTYHYGFPCADIYAKYNGIEIDIKETTCSLYFDDEPINSFTEIDDLQVGDHKFTVVIQYNGETAVDTKELYYGGSQD